MMRLRGVNAEHGWLFSILALGAIARFYRLDSQSLWLDEGLQYYVATTNSFWQLFGETRSFHPPLSFLTNYVFLLLGQNEFLLRLPSTLFGIGSLPIFYCLARELASKRVALVATCMLAISPFHIWYSQDGRMYSQLLFFSLLSTVLLLRALRVGGWLCWLSYILVSAAGVYTHLFMLLALMAQFFWVLAYHRDRWLLHAVGGVVVLVAFLPWIIFLPWVQRFFQSVARHGLASEAPAGSIAAFRAGFSFESVTYTFFTYSSGFSLGPTVAELHENKSFAFILQFLPEVLFVCVVFGTLLIVGVYGLYKVSGARAVTLCILGLAIPVLGTLMYALAPRAAYNVRYTIVAFPYFCLLVGAGFVVIYQKQRALAVVFGVGVLAISSMSLANYFFNPQYAKEDVRSAVAFWRSEASNEPLLSYSSFPVVLAYLHNDERDRHAPVSREIVTDIRRWMLKVEVPSAYVLLARDWGGLREKAIKSAYTVAQERSFPGVKILKISYPLDSPNLQGAL